MVSSSQEALTKFILFLALPYVNAHVANFKTRVMFQFWSLTETMARWLGARRIQEPECKIELAGAD